MSDVGPDESSVDVIDWARFKLLVCLVLLGLGAGAGGVVSAEPQRPERPINHKLTPHHNPSSLGLSLSLRLQTHQRPNQPNQRSRLATRARVIVCQPKWWNQTRAGLGGGTRAG